MCSLITGDYSFGKNINPDQVTADLRAGLIVSRWNEFGLCLALIVPSGVVVALVIFIAAGLGDPNAAPEWWPDPFGFVLLVVGIFALFIGFILNKTRAQVRLLRDGVVTKGIVKWVEVTDRLGGHPTAKLGFRYIPAELLDLPDSDLLSSDIPHFAKQVSLPADSGSFGAGLKPGSLISVLYDPQEPLRSLIVDEFRT